MMSSHNFYFVLAIGAFIAALAAISTYYYVLARRSSKASWEDLLGKLKSIDRNVIEEVALDRMESNDEQTEADAEGLDPGTLWKMIGGLQGLEVIEQNSKVLIDLACYLQRWYPEALPIAEQLRLDSRALQFHVDRLKGAAKTGNLEISFPFYAQRAVSTYYVMTRRVLALYQAADFAMLPQLQKAL
jgi:hypothetical protein